MAESSHERLRRLLVLVPWLAAHSGIPKAQAAAHFGLTIAQLEADLGLITVTGPGLYGGDLVDIYFDDETVTVYDAQGLLEPVQMSSDESAALILGLQVLQQLPDADAAIAASLLEKLGGAPEPEFVVNIASAEFAGEVSRALQERNDLAITYMHPIRDDVTDRIVTPWQLVTTGGVEYLHGFCHSAGAARTFRLDRIVRCRTVSTPGEAAPQDLAQRMQHTATLDVDPAYESLLEPVEHDIVQRGDRITANLRYGDESWLLHWLMECGSAVRCTSPAHIAAELARRSESARNLYLHLH